MDDQSNNPAGLPPGAKPVLNAPPFVTQAGSDDPVEAFAVVFRNGGLHRQNDAVVKAAKLVSEMGEDDAEAASERFHQNTGFPREAFEREVAKHKAAAENETA
jgi:hypothetical protein